METNSPSRTNDGTITVPVVQEEVHVGVQQVDTGHGVRIHKTVSEQVHRIEETLLREAVSVTRVPVDKIVPHSEAPQARQEGDTWIVPIMEEILVVEKRLRIKEEVHITRTAQAEPYSDTVVLRSENVSIERFEDSTETQVNTPNGGTHHATHSRSGI